MPFQVCSPCKMQVCPVLLSSSLCIYHELNFIIQNFNLQAGACTVSSPFCMFATWSLGERLLDYCFFKRINPMFATWWCQRVSKPNVSNLLHDLSMNKSVNHYTSSLQIIGFCGTLINALWILKVNLFGYVCHFTHLQVEAWCEFLRTRELLWCWCT